MGVNTDIDTLSEEDLSCYDISGDNSNVCSKTSDLETDLELIPNSKNKNKRKVKDKDNNNKGKRVKPNNNNNNNNNNNQLFVDYNPLTRRPQYG